MATNKVLVGPIVMAFAILLLGVWGATQWAASMLGYQAQLGPPWHVMLGIPFYRPWQVFDWWYRYGAYARFVFDKAGMLAGVSGFLGCTTVIGGSLWRARHAGHVSTYGSARWASRRDIKQAGLFARDGVMLGGWGRRYLRHAGPDHVLVFAPTRSGKGVGLVVPTLLSWTGSAVIHDIKGENWTLTAGWRVRFSHCLRFDPTDARSARYNPLFEVRRGAREVADAQNIADILIDPEGVLTRRNHWEQASHALLVGAILHVLHFCPEKTLAAVARLLSDPDQPFAKTLETMLTANHLGDDVAPLTHPVVAAAARDLLNKSEAERSGILSTAIGFLSLYRDPLVAGLTASSDWRIVDLLDATSPVSLYLVIPPSDLSRTRPLVRLILNQIGRRLTEQLPERTQTRQLLLMLDEFPALGRLDFFETALAFLAGYGVRAFLVAQSLHQIAKAYGENSSILDNCRIRVAFSTNDERTAKRISDALGTATHQRAMRSYGGSRLAAWLPHVTESHQETGRALLTPGEIMQLSADEAVLLVSACPPIQATKLRYHADRHLQARILPPPASQTGWRDRPAGRDHDWQAAQASPAPSASATATIASPAARSGRPTITLGLEELSAEAFSMNVAALEPSGHRASNSMAQGRDGHEDVC
jgi:type IV secretion system protein VirD4